jgi:HAD superfamily hydrolase (TIGR01509 family)
VIEAIFWDNDGVLVDTEPLYFEATRQVLASIGVHLTRDQYLDLFLIQGRGAWHLAEDAGLGAAAVEQLRLERNALYGDWLAREPRLVEGVAETLSTLHGRYVMAVVTSSRKDHFEIIHRHTGILGCFDFILTSDDFTSVKPHPEPYLRAVERSGRPREACVAIEDSERGLQSASRAGIDCIVVPSGLTRGCRFAGARAILGSVREVPAALGHARPGGLAIDAAGHEDRRPGRLDP